MPFFTTHNTLVTIHCFTTTVFRSVEISGDENPQWIVNSVLWVVKKKTIAFYASAATITDAGTGGDRRADRGAHVRSAGATAGLDRRLAAESGRAGCRPRISNGTVRVAVREPRVRKEGGRARRPRARLVFCATLVTVRDPAQPRRVSRLLRGGGVRSRDENARRHTGWLDADVVRRCR